MIRADTATGEKFWINDRATTNSCCREMVAYDVVKINVVLLEDSDEAFSLRMIQVFEEIAVNYESLWSYTITSAGYTLSVPDSIAQTYQG